MMCTYIFLVVVMYNVVIDYNHHDHDHHDADTDDNVDVYMEIIQEKNKQTL